MTQDNRECNDMNSAFEKLRIASDESDRNNDLDILKPKILDAIDQIRQRKKRPDTDSIYDFIARTCATNINKELIEVVIEELIAQNDVFNKKTAQGQDSFYKVNEKEVPLPNASPSIEISNTQSPITSDNEILEPSEEEPRDFDKTSNTIIDIQTPTLQKSLSYENLGTPQDIRNIRVQFSVLKSHVMCELSSLNQKISSPSENLEKAVNNMKVQNTNVDLLNENIKIFKMNYPKRMKSSNLLWKFNRQCLVLYQQEEMTNCLRSITTATSPSSSTTTTTITTTTATKTITIISTTVTTQSTDNM